MDINMEYLLHDEWCSYGPWRLKCSSEVICHRAVVFRLDLPPDKGSEARQKGFVGYRVEYGVYILILCCRYKYSNLHTVY